MKLRRLLFIFPLCLALAACLDPTGPRVPDDDQNPDEEPNQNALVVDWSGH